MTLERYLTMSEELKLSYKLKEVYQKWFQRVKELGKTQIDVVKKSNALL